MSHTTTIKSVPVKDIEAARTAVEELQAKGINCELLDNCKPRMYYTDGRQDIQCEHVIRLHDSRYDVGLKYNEKEDHYEMVCDLWGSDIQKQVGASCPVSGASEVEMAIGAFAQGYAKNAAINAAQNAGYSVMDSYIDDQGNAQVELMVS